MDSSTNISGPIPATPVVVPLVRPSPAEAKSELGRRLHEIRARIVASGEPLLNWDDLDAELRERRGEPAGA